MKERLNPYGLATKVLALSAALAACSTWPIREGNESDLRPIQVQDVRVEVGVGSPIPVDVLVSGSWPDLCAQLAQTTQNVQAGSIRISLLATQSDPSCPPDFVGLPFRLALPLNIVELPAGDYLIDVNGVTTQFEWTGGPSPTG